MMIIKQLGIEKMLLQKIFRYFSPCEEGTPCEEVSRKFIYVRSIYMCSDFYSAI